MSNSELISEVDAFIAWKNGQEVEIYDESMCWHTLCRDHGLCVFDSKGRVKFRLKPHTVTINNIEVDKPDSIHFLRNDGSVYLKYSDKDKARSACTALRSVFNVE